MLPIQSNPLDSIPINTTRPSLQTKEVAFLLWLSSKYIAEINKDPRLYAINISVSSKLLETLEKQKIDYSAIAALINQCVDPDSLASVVPSPKLSANLVHPVQAMSRYPFDTEATVSASSQSKDIAMQELSRYTKISDPKPETDTDMMAALTNQTLFKIYQTTVLSLESTGKLPAEGDKTYSDIPIIPINKSLIIDPNKIPKSSISAGDL